VNCHPVSLSGYASVCVSWEKPWDDGDATVSGYQLMVDGLPWGKQLPLSANDVKMKVIVSNPVLDVGFEVSWFV
jgi:hypothetical protein